MFNTNVKKMNASSFFIRLQLMSADITAVYPSSGGVADPAGSISQSQLGLKCTRPQAHLSFTDRCVLQLECNENWKRKTGIVV